LSRKRRLVVIAWVAVPVIVLLALAGAALAFLPGPVVQPIVFNHHLHVEELGAECVDCHRYARSGARATIPNIQVCADCHVEALTESPEEAKLIEYIEQDRLIPWRKIYWVPDHVYFSHRRHTTIAGIECETCHGAIRERELPLDRRLVPVTMDDCIGCHEKNGAAHDCLLCHR
jgi:hypothetical protein